MGNLENLVRATLHDVAREARPADLTRAAMTQARRTTRYRLLKFIAGLTAIVVGAVGTVVVLGGTADQPPPLGVTTLYYSDGTTVLAELGDAPVGLDQPTGLVVSHVLSELSTAAASPWRGQTWSQIRVAGAKIITTIDPRAQAELERAVDPSQADSPVAEMPENLRAAAVMVEPGTGRVLSYYGGSDGTGPDLAGVFVDENGEVAGLGRHPPGGSFQVHTLAAALNAGYSLNSYWQWTPHPMPGRGEGNLINNASECPGAGNELSCSLLDSTTASLNVPFYALTVSVGPANVLSLARDAGVDSMWNDSGERQVLTGGRDINEVVPSQFDFILGIGQYPITVLDQANAMATYAAAGVRANAHFVRAVWLADEPVYGETLPAADQAPILSASASADLDWALSRTEAGRIEGRDVATKTGEWQYGASIQENAHAWTVGYTRELAMAVWVGAFQGGPIRASDGSAVSGATVPAGIYRAAMAATHTAMNLPDIPFPAPVFAGELNPPGSVPG